jgi:Lanthionine synthetase C-like protein/Protein kinase domain
MPEAPESPARAKSSVADRADPYAELLADLLESLSSEWVVRRHDDAGIRWYSAQPRTTSLPDQGWKLHLSTSHGEACELCERVLPFLVFARASFKILRDVTSILAANSGRAGPTQVGKVLTVYGALDVDFATLARDLARTWPRTNGPRVLSDLTVSGTNGVSLRYGVIAGTRTVVDRLGRHAFALRRPDGVDVPDQRTTNGLQPDWATPPPVPCATSEEIDIDSRFQIADETYLPMVLLNRSTRGATYLGIAAGGGRSVVLKTAVPGVPYDLSGRDAVDLLEREYVVLGQLASLTNVAPRPLGFEPSDVPVLAVEDLEGDSLDELPPETALSLVPRLASAVAELHALGYVHGDIKLSNAVAVDGDVRLVDFGLAGKAGQRDVFGGTRNYIAPEGTDGPAGPAGDVFSLGVSVAGAFLGVEPATLPAPPARLLSLLRLMREGATADLLEPVLHADPENRPTAQELASQLSAIQRPSEIGTARRAARPRALSPGRSWCMRAAASAAAASRQYLERDGDTGWWRNAHMESAFVCEGINLGAAGIILGLISVDHALRRNDLEHDVTCGCNWLAERPSSDEALGLFSGDAGVALALAVAGRRYSRDDWTAAAHARLENAATIRPDYDLFSGLAGVLYAATSIDRFVEGKWAHAIGRRLADHLRGAARITEEVLVWPAFEEREEPLMGAAHGSAGVALALADWCSCARDDDARTLALDTFSRLFAHARADDGGLMRSFDVPNTEDRLWCHGSAGYLWCLLVGFGDEPMLRDAVDWSAERFFASAILTSPVYCHGLAGQLDLCRLLEQIDRFRALAQERSALLVGALRLLAERRGGHVVWTSEEPETITPDLWIGFLGPAVALARHAATAEGSLFSPEWFVACSEPTTGR